MFDSGRSGNDSFLFGFDVDVGGDGDDGIRPDDGGDARLRDGLLVIKWLLRLVHLIEDSLYVWVFFQNPSSKLWSRFSFGEFIIFLDSFSICKKKVEKISEIQKRKINRFNSVQTSTHLTRFPIWKENLRGMNNGFIVDENARLIWLFSVLGGMDECIHRRQSLLYAFRALLLDHLIFCERVQR